MKVPERLLFYFWFVGVSCQWQCEIWCRKDLRIMDIGELPIKSMEAVKRKDRKGWLALFAEDAVLEDPVGPSEWDPEGRGQQGKEAIGRFYDIFSDLQESYDYEVHHKVVRGNEIAVSATFHMHMKDGNYLQTRSINLYTVNDAGKVVRLRSFWNAEDGPDV